MKHLIVHFDIKDKSLVENIPEFFLAFKGNHIPEPFEWGFVDYPRDGIRIRFFADIETKQETVYKIRRV